MSYQICPKCEHESFLWTAHGEPYVITTWYCSNCNYIVYEDERLETVCSVCGNKTKSLLKDYEQEYWYCFTCNAITSD